MSRGSNTGETGGKSDSRPRAADSCLLSSQSFFHNPPVYNVCNLLIIFIFKEEMGIAINPYIRQVKDLCISAITVDSFCHETGFLEAYPPVILSAMGTWIFRNMVSENHKDGNWGKLFKITSRNGHAFQRSERT